MENSDSARISTTGGPAFQLPDGSKTIPLGSGEITKRLGTGGMATVYEIWNSRLEMHRAVKIINPGSAETAYTRFETEIKISAKLRHPNIVEVHGTGDWNGLPFIEMEKVDGRGIDQVIKDRGAFPEAVCAAIGIMICRALDYAHHRECVIYGVKYQGVIHRDLKPSNIMLTSNGTVKLMDFGIARPMDATFQTMEGLVSGTLQYLSPEQIEKRDLDARTDIYTLGICLYEMATGAIAFPQTSFAELVTFKTKSRFKPIDEFPVRVSVQFKRAIARCMQQDPGKRFQDAAELLAELEKIHLALTNETPEAVLARFAADSGNKRAPAAHQSRFSWKVLATVLGVGGIAVLGYMVVLPALRPHTIPVAAVAPAAGPAKVHASPDGSMNKTPLPAGRDPSLSAAKHQDPTIQTSLPVASAPQNPVRERSNEKRGGSSFAATMEKELKNGNFAGVLKACEGPEAPAEATLYKLRALQGLRNEIVLASFLRNTDLSDGEWYLAKAKLSFKKEKYHECENFLRQCQETPCAIMSATALDRESSYYTALCATIRFDANPNRTNYTKVTGAWQRVQELARTGSRDPYGKKAETELARMEKVMMGRE